MSGGVTGGVSVVSGMYLSCVSVVGEGMIAIARVQCGNSESLIAWQARVVRRLRGKLLEQPRAAVPVSTGEAGADFTHPKSELPLLLLHRLSALLCNIPLQLLPPYICTFFRLLSPLLLYLL